MKSHFIRADSETRGWRLKGGLSPEQGFWRACQLSALERKAERIVSEPTIAIPISGQVVGGCGLS
jgi:hypothetical protein